MKSGYAPVNGLKLYYEIHGAVQPPLVLLRGGGDTIKTSFGHILAELARNRQAIAVEQQGYGHTADPPYERGQPFWWSVMRNVGQPVAKKMFALQQRRSG